MQARPATAELDHGGRLNAARRLFPQAPAPFLDLSTGINPVSYSIGSVPADGWTRLPESETVLDLQRAACVAYGVTDPAMVVAAPGTQILISLLPLLLPYRQVAILGPTYGEHAATWRASGAAVTMVAHLDAHTQCAVLCNPNNPDGRRTDKATLLAIADALARDGGMLIVDEAFADIDPALSLAPYLPHPALLILRSFGKAYGLAGLRLGFALASPDRAAMLRHALGPWAVSGPAAAIGATALRDQQWMTAAIKRLRHDSVRLDALLIVAGFRVVGGTGLFRLVETSEAERWFQRLGRAGILVRRFADSPNWLRFGIPGDQPAWDRLETTLRA